MDLPSTAHIIYIPIVLTIGMALGFVWGSRATREAYQLEQRRLEERARRKAERAAAREAAEAPRDEPPAPGA
jgi:hypothetical protein